MNRKIKYLQEMKDSRLLYEKEIPRFGYILIIVVGFLIIGTVIWSIKTPKVYMVKAQGIVQSDNKNYVMPGYTGKIVNIKIKEGVLVEKGEELFTIKSDEMNLQLIQLLEQEKNYESRIAQFEKLVKSIKDDKNYFDASCPKDNLYYGQFEAYKSQVAQNQVDVSSCKAYGYSEEQIENQLILNQSKVSEIYYNAVQSAENSIVEAKTQIDSIESQKMAINEGKEEYKVTAPETGIIHMLSEYKEGMVVQSASPVASISSEKDKYTIIAYVSVSDATKTHVGDKVDVEINGLAQSIYGTISGKVIQMDSDLTTQNTDNVQQKSFFKAYIKPDNVYLINKEGNKVNISNGMVVEARIQYDEVTYFDYVVEALEGISR